MKKRLQITDSPLQFIARGKAGRVWIYFTIRHGAARLDVSYTSQEEAEDGLGLLRVWASVETPKTPQDGIAVLVDLAGHLSEEIRSVINEHLPPAA